MQEGTFVASECLRKAGRGLAAAEDTAVSCESAGQPTSSCQLANPKVHKAEGNQKSKSPKSRMKSEIQKYTKPKEIRNGY